MTLIPTPWERLAGSLEHVEQTTFDKAHYERLGVVVLRNAIPAAVMECWINAWTAFQSQVMNEGRKIDPYNPVVLHEAVSPALDDIHRHPVLLDLIQQIYPDLALYVQRFVVKDGQSKQAVFIHQDYCYDLGMPEKTSVFLPLGTMNPENGGLMFFPGTHLLGYLGDAGELNREILDPQWPVVCPSLTAGDVVLMHECTWHGSGPHLGGPDRIVVQMTFQPASDPSGIELLRGGSPFGMPLGKIDRDALFVRSRSSRLRELQGLIANSA
jgi:hypothetical protein